MNNSLTIIDRLIIETIQKKTFTLEELQINTKLQRSILESSLFELITKELVINTHQGYTLAENIENDLALNFNTIDSLHNELTDITQTCIRNRLENDQKTFQLKKVYMNSSEEKIFRGLLYNLNSFLDSLDSKNKKTSSKKIIFWGEDSYENICNSILNY